MIYLSAAVLTAFTDNAALTFLGSQVSLTELSRYSLLAGAVAGGGLTVIANAPNPIGYSLTEEAFREEGFSSLKLAKGALVPTVIALICLGL
jgi:Na+/H+ antiporter NhaD/arsenite permease-like protein